MKKQIIITGGAGFIGIHLTKKLIKNNYHVIIIDDLSNANIGILKSLAKNAHTLIESDINETAKILNDLKNFNPSQLIHLAAVHYIPFCVKNSKETKIVNTDGTLSALKIAKEKNISNFIFSSSAAVYKPSKKSHKENSKLSPIEIYGQTKLDSEKIIENFCNKNKIGYTILRLFNIYGSNDLTPHFVSSIIKRINKSNCVKAGNLETKRDYVFIDDLINAIFKIIKDKKAPNKIFNIGAGIGASGKEVIKLISGIKKIKIAVKEDRKLKRKNDREALTANIDKISKTYKWKPQYNLRKGLKKLLLNEQSKQ